MIKSLVCTVVFLLSLGNTPDLQTFSSPLSNNFYLPTVSNTSPQTKKGVNLRNGECGLIDLVGAGWFHDWGNDWCYPHGQTPYADMIFSWPDPLTGWRVVGDYVQGYNEPNLIGQANVPPALAAIGWRWIEIGYPEKILVSPAFSQPLDQNTCLDKSNCGIQWLLEMVDAYEVLYQERPRFDRIAVHWYGSYAADMMGYLAEVHQVLVNLGYDKGIWVTEFGSCPTPHRISFMEEIMNWMDNTDWIERYAWYSSRVPASECDVNLLNNDGTLTEIGAIYRDHP